MNLEGNPENEEPEVKYIDSAEFEDCRVERSFGEIQFRWVEALETEETKWHRLLTDFLSPLAGKNGFCTRIAEKYAKSLHYLGCEVVQADYRFQYQSLAAPKKVRTSTNLPIALWRFSELTKNANVAQYVGSVLSFIGQESSAQHCMILKSIHVERLANLSLYSANYRQGLENMLSNNRLMRNFRHSTKRLRDQRLGHTFRVFHVNDVFTMSPETTSLALQLVLDDWNCSLQDEKIVQLAHGSALQMRGVTVKGDAFYILCESLICAIALNYPMSQQEMEDFDSIIRTKSVRQSAKQRFGFWKAISKYERNWKNTNPQVFLVSAERMEQECKSEGIGAACAVMVETACKIRRKCDGGHHEQIMNTITDTVTRYPSLGPRMMQIAENCEVGCENELIMEQICDVESPNHLHSSDATWLVYVESRLAAIGKFGSVRKSVKKLLKVIFAFLDFDSNRFTEKAWFLMEKVLEMADPSFVVPEWEERKDWWPGYQRSEARNGGRRMGKKAMKKREAVLTELEKLSC